MDRSGDDLSPADEGEALAGFVVISELTSCPSSEEEEANLTDSPLEGQLGEYIGLYIQQYGSTCIGCCAITRKIVFLLEIYYACSGTPIVIHSAQFFIDVGLLAYALAYREDSPSCKLLKSLETVFQTA